MFEMKLIVSGAGAIEVPPPVSTVADTMAVSTLVLDVRITCAVPSAPVVMGAVGAQGDSWRRSGKAPRRGGERDGQARHALSCRIRGRELNRYRTGAIGDKKRRPGRCR